MRIFGPSQEHKISWEIDHDDRAEEGFGSGALAHTSMLVWGMSAEHALLGLPTLIKESP